MRNVFYRVSCALARFMYGRNGSDQLNVALLVVYLFICLLRALFIHSVAAAAFFNILTLLTAAALLLRMFSRNLERRRAENALLVVPCPAAAQRPAPAEPGQGPQVLHLQKLQDRLPGARREGED